MAETEDEDDFEREAGAQPDNFAAAIALGPAPADVGEARKAEKFLEAQTRLIDIQAEHLHEQRELMLSRLRWGRFSDRMKAALQILTALVGLAIAAGIAAMAWNAGQSNGLLIEKFSVPPALTQRGLTGEVLAARMLDHLVAMQRETSSARPAKSYAESWSENTIRIDIPETGVSLAELEAYLQARLGHDTHVGGEIVQTAKGLSITARTGDDAQTLKGSEEDLDGMIQRLSETVYRLTQPYRYASWLASHRRPGEALPIFKALALYGPPQEKPWGYYGWGSIAMENEGVGALHILKTALALEPDNILVLRYISSIEELNGMPEVSLRDYRRLMTLARDQTDLTTQRHIASERIFAKAGVFMLTGDFQAAAQLPALAADVARRQIGAHDVAGARATMAGSETTPLSEIPGAIAVDNAGARMRIDVETHDWPAAIAEARTLAPLVAVHKGLASFLLAIIDPYLAQAMAGRGDVAGAGALIAKTPGDCDICLRVRALIADMQGQPGRADYWYGRAISAAPSIPFAYADWGRALLVRGKNDDAIVQFKRAITRGPRFADPLEGWGEALMAQNRSDLALDKFVEASRLAPHWGRLHLKWGAALAYAGKPQEAGAQFAAAAKLFLTAPERAELFRLTH